jgi:hypothetical protein
MIRVIYSCADWLRLVCLVMALYCCGALELYGQQPPAWPVTLHGNTFGAREYNDTKVQYGYILLKYGDTLRGEIKLVPCDPGFPDVFFLASVKFTRRDIMAVPRYEISYVRTYPDPQMPDSDVTDFVNLHNRDLWRKLASKDSWTIYDDYTPNLSDHPFGNEMILVGKDKKWIKIYHHRYHDFDAEVLPLILNFINKRYYTHFQPGDFQDAQAMTQYILDKERATIL